MNYWLLKSEPDEFSIDDLERVGREPWTGVRNYQARNYLRDAMKIGDGVLFYHSNATPPGLAGIGRVVSEAYADPTQFNPDSDYYDPKSDPDTPRWQLRDTLGLEAYAFYASGQDRLSERDLVDPRINPDGTAGWATLNARVSWRVTPAFELSLRAENLADRHYREHGSGLDEPGRNVIVTVDYRF